MANWYKGRLDPTFITIMQLIEGELKKYGDDKESQQRLMADIRDSMTILLKSMNPPKKKWYQFW